MWSACIHPIMKATWKSYFTQCFFVFSDYVTLGQTSVFAHSSDCWDYSVVLCTLFICCSLIPLSMDIRQVHWTMTVCTDVVMHASKVGGTCFVCFCQRESPHFSLCLSRHSKGNASHSSNTLTFLKGISEVSQRVCSTHTLTDILHRALKRITLPACVFI